MAREREILCYKQIQDAETLRKTVALNLQRRKITDSLHLSPRKKMDAIADGIKDDERCSPMLFSALSQAIKPTPPDFSAKKTARSPAKRPKKSQELNKREQKLIRDFDRKPVGSGIDGFKFHAVLSTDDG